jgi:hypothetical protein
MYWIAMADISSPISTTPLYVYGADLCLGKGRSFQDVWDSGPGVWVFFQLGEHSLSHLLLQENIFKARSVLHRGHKQGMLTSAPLLE